MKAVVLGKSLFFNIFMLDLFMFDDIKIAKYEDDTLLLYLVKHL